MLLAIQQRANIFWADRPCGEKVAARPIRYTRAQVSSESKGEVAIIIYRVGFKYRRIVPVLVNKRNVISYPPCKVAQAFISRPIPHLVSSAINHIRVAVTGSYVHWIARTDQYGFFQLEQVRSTLIKVG